MKSELYAFLMVTFATLVVAATIIDASTVELMYWSAL